MTLLLLATIRFSLPASMMTLNAVTLLLAVIVNLFSVFLPLPPVLPLLHPVVVPLLLLVLLLVLLVLQAVLVLYSVNKTLLVVASQLWCPMVTPLSVLQLLPDSLNLLAD